MLGWGNDGIVYETDSETAIKALRYQPCYKRERDAYLRLSERGVESVLGFSVPKLISFDNDLLVLEIGIVSPPCVIDFAMSELDHPSEELPPEMMEIWKQREREIFEEKLPVVESILAVFRGHGLYLYDVNLGNIIFEEETD